MPIRLSSTTAGKLCGTLLLHKSGLDSGFLGNVPVAREHGRRQRAGDA